jgi:hypothetical protein
MRTTRAGLAYLVALLALFLFMVLLKAGPAITGYANWCVPIAFIILIVDTRDHRDPLIA